MPPRCCLLTARGWINPPPNAPVLEGFGAQVGATQNHQTTTVAFTWRRPHVVAIGPHGFLVEDEGGQTVDSAEGHGRRSPVWTSRLPATQTIPDRRGHQVGIVVEVVQPDGCVTEGAGSIRVSPSSGAHTAPRRVPIPAIGVGTGPPWSSPHRVGVNLQTPSVGPYRVRDPGLGSRTDC